jgi:hypothetical protein
MHDIIFIVCIILFVLEGIFVVCSYKTDCLVIRVYDRGATSQSVASMRLIHALKGYKNKNWPIRSSFYQGPHPGISFRKRELILAVSVSFYKRMSSLFQINKKGLTCHLTPHWSCLLTLHLSPIHDTFKRRNPVWHGRTQQQVTYRPSSPRYRKFWSIHVPLRHDIHTYTSLRATRRPLIEPFHNAQHDNNKPWIQSTRTTCHRRTEHNTHQPPWHHSPRRQNHTTSTHHITTIFPRLSNCRHELPQTPTNYTGRQSGSVAADRGTCGSGVCRDMASGRYGLGLRECWFWSQSLGSTSDGCLIKMCDR